MPTIRNGISTTQTRGQSSSANSARGQQSTNNAPQQGLGIGDWGLEIRWCAILVATAVTCADGGWPGPPLHRACAAQQPRRQHEEAAQKPEHAVNRKAHNPKRDKQHPDDRIDEKGQKRQRPAQHEQEAPEQEFHHVGKIRSVGHAGCMSAGSCWPVAGSLQ